MRLKRAFVNRRVGRNLTQREGRYGSLGNFRGVPAGRRGIPQVDGVDKSRRSGPSGEIFQPRRSSWLLNSGSWLLAPILVLLELLELLVLLVVFPAPPVRFAQSVRCACGNRGLRLRGDRLKLGGNQGASGTIHAYNLPRRTTDVWSVCPCGLHKPGCRLARRSTLECRKARAGVPFVLQ